MALRQRRRRMKDSCWPLVAYMMFQSRTRVPRRLDWSLRASERPRPQPRGTTKRVTALTAPPCSLPAQRNRRGWPAEREPSRPDWSRRAEFPPDRLGLFVGVWAEITDQERFFAYSLHYRWTVEDEADSSSYPGRDRARSCWPAGRDHTPWR